MDLGFKQGVKPSKPRERESSGVVKNPFTQISAAKPPKPSGDSDSIRLNDGRRSSSSTNRSPEQRALRATESISRGLRRRNQESLSSMGSSLSPRQVPVSSGSCYPFTQNLILVSPILSSLYCVFR